MLGTIFNVRTYVEIFWFIIFFNLENIRSLLTLMLNRVIRLYERVPLELGVYTIIVEKGPVLKLMTILHAWKRR